MALAALVAVAAGCGGSHASAPPSTGFAWLRPEAPPAGWRMVALPSGAARLPVPPGWRLIHGDAGTVSAAVLGGDGRIAGYLNATPQQGAETPAGWARFRTEHNAEEGDTGVRTIAAARGLRFRDGHGSCVEDTYRTSTARYREVACLVRGRSAGTVIVAAATPARWPALEATLERAVSGFIT